MIERIGIFVTAFSAGYLYDGLGRGLTWASICVLIHIPITLVAKIFSLYIRINNE